MSGGARISGFIFLGLWAWWCIFGGLLWALGGWMGERVVRVLKGGGRVRVGGVVASR